MVLLLEGLSPSYLSGPFNDAAIFPDEIGEGSVCGHSWKTMVHRSGDGEDWRTQEWSRPLREFTVGLGTRVSTDHARFMSFFRERGGAYEGFRYRDRTDWSTSATGTHFPDGDSNWEDREIVGATIVGDDQYQLVRRYRDSGYEVVRPITHPIPEGNEYHSMKLWIGGVEQVIGTDYRVDYTTGLVTLTTVPTETTAGQQIEWSGTFHVPVRFGVELDEAGFPMQVTGSDVWTGPSSIPMLEIPQEVRTGDPFYPGGVSTLAITFDYKLSLSRGRFFRIDPQNNTASVVLPSAQFRALGGAPITIVNISELYLFAVNDSEGNQLIAGMLPGEVREFWLRDN